MNTEVVGSAAAYGSTPRIELTTREPVAAVGPTSPIDFGSMFGTFRTRSQELAGCPGRC